MLKFHGGVFRTKITRKSTGGWEGGNKTKFKAHGDTLRFPSGSQNSLDWKDGQTLLR